MSIPKIIHYCWFGTKPMPENEAKYVSGWKKILPDYDFKLWNEQNFDVNSTKFTKQVASARKWGFIVDYIRAYAIFNYGGIYLDTDVEVIKSFDDLLDNVCFAGFQEEFRINPGCAFGGEKGCRIALEIMNYYRNYKFIKWNGSLNLTTSSVILSKILKKYGVKPDNKYQKLPEITIYPNDYFSPKLHSTGQTTISENTYSIHHQAVSWASEESRKARNEMWYFYEKYGSDEELVKLYQNVINVIPLKKLYKTVIKRTIKRIIGDKMYDKLKSYRNGKKCNTSMS